MKKINRETWLRTAYRSLRKELISEAPEQVAIGWGFPSKSSMGHKKRRVGECWHAGFGQKPEGNTMILISPTVEDSVQILDVLLHEMVHAATPGEGHRKAFSQLAKRVGLMKPWTATTPGDELKEKLTAIAKRLPPWPKGTVIPVAKQKGRQMKAQCRCGRILRGAKKTLDQGPIVCGLCESEFTLVE